MSITVPRAAVTIIMTFLLVFTLGVPQVYGAFRDTTGHWASSAIESLAAQQIIGGYPDNTFRPEQPITRGEFAKLLATAFDVEPLTEDAFRDTVGHWASDSIAGLAQEGFIDGYPDGTFRPDQPISRAESVRMLARASELTGITWFTSADEPSYSDVDVTHWAFPAVQAMEHMGLLPVFIGDKFGPDTSLTRAEAAWMTYQSMRIGLERGTVTFVDLPTQRVTLKTDQGRIRDFRINNETIILRGDALDSLDGLNAGDALVVVADRFGTPRLMEVQDGGLFGGQSEDLTQRIASAILEVFTVNELQQMVAGDWSVAVEGVQREVSERLVEAGMTASETEALLEQDWTTLQTAVTGRLQDELKDRLNISDELAQALIEQDWTTAREQAQLEVAEHLLNRLLSTLDAPA